MAKRINRDQIRRSKQLPTTGDGKVGGQKPKLSETNLQGSGKQTWVARLFTRRSQPGKHSSN